MAQERSSRARGRGHAGASAGLPPALTALAAVLAALVVIALLAVPRAYCDGALRLAVIGDRTGGAEPGKYEEIISEVERLRPEIVMTVGDMIEGYEADSAVTKVEWKAYKELLKPLTMPIHFTPGNHDIWDTRSLALYKRYVDEPYYSFDVGNVHFVVLDNGRYATVDAYPKQQLEWLRDDLRTHRDAAYTLVFLHIPYWSDAVAEGKPDALHSLFVEYGVDAVFSGHDHTYYSGRFDGISYTDVGSSGAYCSPGLTGLEHHFVWVTLDGKGIAISPVKIGGVLPWDEVTIKDYKLAGKIGDQAVEINKVPVGTAITVSEAPVRVTVKNLNDSLALKAPLTWETPPGWTVTPSETPLDVGPLSKVAADFTAGTDVSIYPPPVLSIQYPYGGGKTMALKRALPITRSAYAYKAARPPDIDGKVTEKVWRDPVTALFAPDGKAMIAEPVSFYFAYDRDNLYLAARCTESQMKSLAARFKNQDDPVHAEDCIGFFLQPNTADGPVYQIYFSPLGTAFDQKITVAGGTAASVDPKWNGKYKVKTSRGKDYWSIEARIPMDQLGTRGKSGKVWAVNFRRKQKRLDTAADWQIPTGYNPKDYGTLVFK